MSQEDVEVVRRFNEPYEGEDVTSAIRAMVDRLGPDPDAERVLAVWADDPAYRYLHRDFEWDLRAGGALGATARGPSEVMRGWAQWVEDWKSYAYRIVEYRDLGAWVLTPTMIQARGPADTPLEMRVFQTWKVRDGKIAVLRAFLGEREALEGTAAPQ